MVLKGDSMRVVISGAVKWNNAELIRSELSKLPKETTIIHGDAPGADALGGEIAKMEFGYSVEKFEKNSDDYRKYQRGAWKALNERMIASNVQLVLCFHENIDKSKGTKHIAKIAEQNAIPVKVISD